MTAIETAPKAQAQDGGSMTEEQLLGTAKEGPIATQMTAEHPSPRERRAGGLTRKWLAVWTLPFRALRELYWLLDADAKVRAKGLQTVGRVLATETTTRTYQGEYGPETITTYHVTYQFVANGLTHTAQKKVGSLANLARDTDIRVYYLPDSYPIESAIDWEPGRVARSQ